MQVAWKLECKFLAQMENLNSESFYISEKFYHKKSFDLKESKFLLISKYFVKIFLIIIQTPNLVDLNNSQLHAPHLRIILKENSFEVFSQF